MAVKAFYLRENMSRLLVILFAAGIVIIGLQPINQNYGGVSGLLSSLSRELSVNFSDLSVEKWANRLESRRNNSSYYESNRYESNSRSSSSYEVKPRKPLFPRSATESSTSTGPRGWLSRLLPKERGQNSAPSTVSPTVSPQGAILPTDDLTADDREELDELLGDL